MSGAQDVCTEFYKCIISDSSFLETTPGSVDNQVDGEAESTHT